MSMNIVEVGARCPLGLDALQTAMAVRAGLLEPRSCDLLDKRKQRIGCVRARWLDDHHHGVDRWLSLGVPALAEACRHRHDDEPVPIWLALPGAGRPDDDADRVGTIIAELAHGADIQIDLERSGVVRGGPAAFVKALMQAEDAVNGGDVVVGGLDSYFHPDTLAWLDEGCRLHAPGAMDGFVPGEGAAFVRLAADAEHPMARLSHVAYGNEATIDTEEPNLAVEMTQLVRNAMQATTAGGWVMSDLNGEAHRLSEWEKVALRCDLTGAHHRRLPGDIGDVGAATGALMLSIAVMWWRSGCALDDNLLMALHSDGGARGVGVVETAHA